MNVASGNHVGMLRIEMVRPALKFAELPQVHVDAWNGLVISLSLNQVGSGNPLLDASEIAILWSLVCV